MASSTIYFRFKRNVMVDLGEQFVIPMVMKHKQVEAPEGTRLALVPEFDLNKVHVATLPDASPRIPRKRAEWDSEFFTEIKRAAYADAIRRRAELAKRLELFRHYSTDAGLNVLEIVSDPEGLLDQDFALSEAEQAVITERQPERLNPRTAKPSQIAQAAGYKS